MLVLLGSASKLIGPLVASARLFGTPCAGSGPAIADVRVATKSTAKRCILCSDVSWLVCKVCRAVSVPTMCVRLCLRKVINGVAERDTNDRVRTAEYKSLAFDAKITVPSKYESSVAQAKFSHSTELVMTA